MLGGFTSIPGAIVGGLIIGVGEKLFEFWIGRLSAGATENWFAYVLALLFLVFRPQGAVWREDHREGVARMPKLIAILNVVAWGGFWAFGYLALTTDTHQPVRWSPQRSLLRWVVHWVCGPISGWCATRKTQGMRNRPDGLTNRIWN